MNTNTISEIEILESRSLFASVGTDPSFNGGAFATRFFAGSDEEASDVVVLKDGRLLVGGASNSDAGGYQRKVFAVYDKAGKLSRSFDGDGKLILSAADSAKLGYIEDLQLLKDGNVLVVGHESLLKLQTSGGTDTTFGTKGFIALPVEPKGAVYLRSTQVLADGSLREATYDKDTGVLSLANYSSAGKSTRSLHRTVTANASSMVATPTAEVLAYFDGTAQAYRSDLSKESKFGSGGTLNVTSGFAKWAKANGPWATEAGDNPTDAPDDLHGLTVQAVGKNGFVFEARTDYLSKKVPSTYGEHESWTNVYFYSGFTGSAVTVAGGHIDGTKLASTDFDHFSNTFTTTTNKRVDYASPFYDLGEQANGFAAAGDGKYYVVGVTFGDFENNNYSFTITKTAYIG